MTDENEETDLEWFSGVLAAATPGPWRVERNDGVPEVTAGPMVIADVVTFGAFGENATAIAALGSVGRELLALAEMVERVTDESHGAKSDTYWLQSALRDVKAALRAARERAR